MEDDNLACVAVANEQSVDERMVDAEMVDQDVRTAERFVLKQAGNAVNDSGG